jgi:alkanesulfonate monooxygenase SsuD/methylene tetrahydromethanopterin reductase-like flavin-dependent oxidoreductase (luciferase family)
MQPDWRRIPINIGPTVWPRRLSGRHGVDEIRSICRVPASPVMTAGGWGVGVPSWFGSGGVAELASVAERVGYASFWFNCAGPDAAPAVLLEAALGATDRITIGVGVVPLDAYPSAGLASELVARSCDTERVIFGVGAGAERARSLGLVREGLVTLQDVLPRVRLSVGTSSPRMIALAAELADAVLLSMTPLTKVDAIEAGLDGAAPSGRDISVDRYHRVSVGRGAADRVAAEMIAYRLWPADRVRPTPSQLLGTAVTAIETADVEVRDALAAWPAKWRHVLRPLPSDPRDIGETRDLLEVLAPKGS